MEDIIDIIVTETTNLIEITSQPTDEIIDVNIIDNREDVTLNVTPTLVEININSLTGNFGIIWGEIEGTLSNQTDLQNALNLKADLVDGKVPSSQLPSYIDDVVEVATYSALPATGETGKIYVVLDTNLIYRWSGSAYIEIKDSSAVWGAITGTLSSQTDLQNALNAKDAILSFSSPLSRSTNTISIPAATTSVNGYLTSTDWNTFNGKQAALNGTGFVKASGTSISYDNSTYLTTSSASSTYVPYTGANASVNLGNNNIEINGTTAYVRVQGGGASGFISESAGAKMQLSPTSLFLTEKQYSPNYTKTLDFRPTILGANYTIVVPDASGTIALTSQLHNAVTIGTANGLSLSTQVLSLGLASSSANGALSSTDWTTFNNKQNALSGTGFVKISGSTISYDNSTYLTTSSASSTYLPLAGGTLTGALFATSASFSGFVGFGGNTSPLAAIDVTGAGRFSSSVTASSHIVSGGTSSQFQKGDGSLDSNTYLTTSSASSTYLAKSGGTLTGALSGTSATFSGLTVDNNQNGSTWIIAKNQNTGSGAAAGFLMTNNTGDLGAISLLSSGNSPANGLFIRTLSTNSLILGTNSTANLTIANGGATTFSSSVTASGIINGTSSQFTSGGTAVNTIYASGPSTFGLSSSDSIYLRRYDIGQYQFQTVSSGASAGNLSLQSYGGNVGIGTTSPQTILSIETSGVQNTISPIITAQSSGVTYVGMYSIRDGAGDQRGLIFQNYTANVGLTEKMRIKSSGIINFSNVPTSSAGLSSGDVYKTVAGVLMIV